jgi:hypothetical protein
VSSLHLDTEYIPLREHKHSKVIFSLVLSHYGVTRNNVRRKNKMAIAAGNMELSKEYFTNY